MMSRTRPTNQEISPRRWSLALYGLGLCAAIILPVLSCATSPTGGIGKLRLLVKDKPFPLDMISAATVTITKIEVRQTTTTSAPTTTTTTAPDDEGETGDDDAMDEQEDQDEAAATQPDDE